ncbi:hypothetical protein ACP70R_012929 [Stipagrostis hirtigluma subsp. patula]
MSHPRMHSSLIPTTSGGAHVCPSPPRPRRRRCCPPVTAAAVQPPSGGVGRRALSVSGVAAWLAATVGRADAANPLDKYVKRKKLEPLETYVPAVLLTRDQFMDLDKSLEFVKPKYDESRSLLRSGPASSLRINIRAVAQYASGNGQGKVASDAVDECLQALEDLDSLLLRASRNDPSASVETMRSKISIALAALDNLLQTVPSAVLDKGKAIADAYRTPADDYVEESASGLDPKLKQLEDIL